ncbi:hypothetical protein [Effusibacillus consociatus]|uniref:Fimbrial protein n=1 Tax=Effusibacillus consociatus TaxID=1117041 RepID=A0ABV9Q1Z7_9BACL
MQINLLPYQPASVTYRTIGLSSLAGLLLLGNLLGIVNWVQYSIQQKEAQSILDTQNASLSKLQEKAAKVQKMQDLDRQAQALEKWAAKHPVFQEELQLLSSLLPTASYLTMARYNGTAVYDLQAELPDMESVATYLHELRNHQRIAAVRVKSATRQNSIQKLEFQVTISR